MKKQKKHIAEVVVKGHANFDAYGKDIVCAAVSAMTINTINAIQSLDGSLEVEKKEGYLHIRVVEITDINQKLIHNLTMELEELACQYPKNIMIRNEE